MHTGWGELTNERDGKTSLKYLKVQFCPTVVCDPEYLNSVKIQTGPWLKATTVSY